MESTWGIAATWVVLALVASMLAIRFKLSVALVEILVGMAAGNLTLLLDHFQAFGLRWELEANEGIAFLAGFGSVLLTFMAGAEVEPAVLRKYLKQSVSIGLASFAVPFVAAMLYARCLGGWDWNAAAICGIALSTTSVAVVYVVMVESRLNETQLGKLILAACFITDLGTVVALGACFANYDGTLLAFAAATAIALWLAPRVVGRFLADYSGHVHEPGIKVILCLLFVLGAMATRAKSEAVLPAYLIGLALASVLAGQRDVVRRLRTTVFAVLTPFYFLSAGMKVYLPALWSGLGLVVILLCVKIGAKTIGVWPLTRGFGLGPRESNYTTLLMSTGLTFGTISALFGLNNGYIDKDQYSILVIVVIASALVPTIIAQALFRPHPDSTAVLLSDFGDASETPTYEVADSL